MQGKKSTEVGIVLDKKETVYSISIDKRCSIFMVEAIAVEKAIGIVQEKIIRRIHININRFPKYM